MFKGMRDNVLSFAVRDTDWVTGPDDAFITLLEYGDYQ